MTKNTSFKIPNSFLNNLDYLVYTGFFKSRGDAIRIAIEDYINDNYDFVFKKDKKEENINKMNELKNEVFG